MLNLANSIKPISMNYITSKIKKAFMIDLKYVYKKATFDTVEIDLDESEAKLGERVPDGHKLEKNGAT